MGILKLILGLLSSLIGLKSTKWRPLPIPNSALLYRRIHFGHVKDDVQGNRVFMPTPSSFKDFDLSCDWNRYSTPLQSFQLIGKEFKGNGPNFKDKNDFFLASFLVQNIIDNKLEQDIEHNPQQFFPEVVGKPNNRAHSLIKGDKGSDTDANHVRIRFWLSQLAKWEIFDEPRLIELRKERGQKKK